MGDAGSVLDGIIMSYSSEHHTLGSSWVCLATSDVSLALSLELFAPAQASDLSIHCMAQARGDVGRRAKHPSCSSYRDFLLGLPSALVSASSEPFEASHLLQPSLSECVWGCGISIKFHLFSNFQQCFTISDQLTSPFLVFQTIKSFQNHFSDISRVLG